MTNGKGDKPRKGANLQRFRNNYSEIDWSKKETAQISLSGHQIKEPIKETVSSSMQM